MTNWSWSHSCSWQDLVLKYSPLFLLPWLQNGPCLSLDIPDLSASWIFCSGITHSQFVVCPSHCHLISDFWQWSAHWILWIWTRWLPLSLVPPALGKILRVLKPCHTLLAGMVHMSTIYVLWTDTTLTPPFSGLDIVPVIPHQIKGRFSLLRVSNIQVCLDGLSVN